MTKAIATWRDKVHQAKEFPDQDRYRFHNFTGEALTKAQLIKLLTSSAASWNNFKRRQKHSIIWYETDKGPFWLPGYIIDLRNTDLRNLDLTDRDLSNIDFSGSSLRRTIFSGSRLDPMDINGVLTGHTKLEDCDLTRTKWEPSTLNYVRGRNADFSHATFNSASVKNCDFRNTKFGEAFIAAEFDGTKLEGADFKDCNIFASSFFNIDLSTALNLNLASYHADCRIDYQTIKLSQNVPKPLLEACGVAHFHIPHIDAISKNSAKHPSCFISYSAKDNRFVEQFRNELANKGIRSWFAPRDLPFGASTRDVIEAQIRSHDRLIVVLSKSSLQSQWVQFEVETALEIERKKGSKIIIPISIDDSVFKTKTTWAKHIARTKNIAMHQDWELSDSSFIDEFVRRISKRIRTRPKIVADVKKKTAGTARG